MMSYKNNANNLAKIAYDNNLLNEILKVISIQKISYNDQDDDFPKPYVTTLQDQLRNIGFKYDFEPGVFDELTEEAVSIVEERAGLPMTGTLNYYSAKEIFKDPLSSSRETEMPGEGKVQKRDVPSKSRESVEKPSTSSKSDFGGNLNTISEGSVSATKLFQDVYSRIKNLNLSVVVVANAYGESGLRYAIGGDCGEYAQDKPQSISISGKGKCCSFGLWQMNICGGLGSAFLREHGNPKGDKERLEILNNYQKQLEFMCNYLISSHSSAVSKKDSIENYVSWFVHNIEKPRNDLRGKAISHRLSYAKKLLKENSYIRNLVNEQNEESEESEYIEDVFSSERLNKLIKFAKLIS